MLKTINLQSVKNFVNKHFNKLFGIEEEILKDFLTNYNYITKNSIKDLLLPNDATLVYFLHTLFNRINIIQPIDINLYNFILSKYSSFIGFDTKIGENFNIFSSKNIYIENGVCIGNDVTLANNIKIGNKKTKPRILNNVKICDNVNIFGNIIIGNNVEIKHGCYITDNIEDNQTISIINQLQLVTKTTKNYLPSQTLIVYGIIPKFKNTIQIVGEGFYNPIVNFKNCSQNLDYSITYWDKNKILIKFKNTKPIFCDHVICSLLCNHVKINILNSVGLTRALENLQP